MPTNQQMAKELLLNYVRYEYDPRGGSEGPEIEVPIHASILFDLPREDLDELEKRCRDECFFRMDRGEEFTDEMAAKIVIDFLDETGFFEE